jgi:hypothetical protein
MFAKVTSSFSPYHLLFLILIGLSYVAILMLASVIGFLVTMDLLKYVFGIDPVESERKALRLKRERNEKKKNS